MEGWLEGDGCVGFSAGGEVHAGRLLMVSRSGVLDYLPSQGLMTTLLSPAALHHHTLFLVRMAAKRLFCLI